MFDQIKAEVCSAWGGDKDAANAAWASSMDKAKLEAKTPGDVMRVVTGVVHNHHDTPKERLWVEFFITCPIFVERQFDKYRMTVQYQGFTVEWYEAPMGRDNITQNELSGRYRTIPDRPFTLPADVARIHSKAAKALSDSNTLVESGEGNKCYVGHLGTEHAQKIAEAFKARLEAQHEWYQFQLTWLKQAEQAGHITNKEYKRVREVFRGILGTAFLTDMRVVMNMNAFEHIVNQRLAKDAQDESRVLAYWMVKNAQAAKVGGETMIAEMIVANGWQPLLDEVEEMIRCDTF